ncbi:hypothetical protein ES332_A06G163100v1 [Gossypium tomentosum]|uniref:Remorin C-terminal domain-containing protein n=1 Tax=Gossypium tomentosum TaxID=34277 RepID=A0A5D2Q5S7_GOSTO|nr:hypothetical protein ES332_A06G163100v1 [Gossypium tomentosum]
MIEPSQKKAKIETQILVAEAAAKMKAEVKLKKQREREREAARIALQKMEKTVEIEKNLEIEMDFVQKRRCIRKNPIEAAEVKDETQKILFPLWNPTL